MEILYRKYRPNKFDDLKGQSNVKDLLIDSILSDNFGHAYLFSGPRGTGKTSSARLFAKAVNCLNFQENNDVCNNCVNCNSINTGEVSDIIEMDAASNRGIEEIRDLKENVNFLPSSLKYKIYIIDEAHMLTKEAFNALLKTLEDTPEHAIFILATTEPHKVPITVRSRLLRFDFKLAEQKTVLEKLRKISEEESIKITDDALIKVYKISGGSFRDAESLLSKVSNHKSEIGIDEINNLLGLADEQVLESILESLNESDFKKIEEIINIQIEKGMDIDNLVDQLIEHGFEIKAKSEIINFLLSLKKEIGIFNNKKVYLLAKIYAFLNDFVQGAYPKIIQQKIIPAVEANTEKVEEKKSSKIINNANELVTQVKNGLESTNSQELFKDIKNKRIEAILSVSKISVEDSKVSIFNQFKFNINFLSKKDIFDMLLVSVQKTLGGQTKLEISIISDKDFKLTSKESRVSTQALQVEDSSALVYSVESSSIETESVSEQIDNSDLVETLF